MHAAELIDVLVAKGVHHFTTEDASHAIKANDAAVRGQLRRLKASKRIASPLRSFHVVLSPEYRDLGCLPADQFIDQLMSYLGEPYYVGLLSAAERYGAAHQRPQTFQVMIPQNRSPVLCGKVSVTFVARRDVAVLPTRTFNTAKGFVRYSTPEQTAFDLVGYPAHAGGLSNVATILGELSSEIEGGKLAEVAEKNPVGWSQRLGLLLEMVGELELASSLEDYVLTHAKSYIPLRRSLPSSGARRDAKWKVIINEDVEPDE